MSFFKVKRDLADKLFSDYIRKRDGSCVRCGKTESLTCSHYWGRKHENTRFDIWNAEALCNGCHMLWEHQKEIKIHNNTVMGEYALYKLSKLGNNGYSALKLRAHSTKKKDRKMEVIRIKELLKQLTKK